MAESVCSVRHDWYGCVSDVQTCLAWPGIVTRTHKPKAAVPFAWPACYLGSR